MTNENSQDPKLEGQLLIIRYVRLDQVALWEDNAKLHDVGGLINSIKQYGFRDAPIYDGTLGCIVAGNGRATALQMMQKHESELPAGVGVDKEGNWYIPVQFGIDASSIEAAEAFGIDHNNLTMTGGDLTLFDIAKMWDEDSYKTMLEKLANAQVELATMDMNDIDLYLHGGIDFNADPQSEPSEENAEEDTTHAEHTLKVIITNNDMIMDAVLMIRTLIAEHEEWGARIE